MSDNTNDNQTLLYENLIVERRPGSEVEIAGEIPERVIAEQRPKAVQSLGRTATLPGFRAGKIPIDVLEKHLGEPRILTEVAEMVLARAYPDIVINEKLDVIGRPAVSLTKVAPGNPIGFRIQTTLMPDVVLPDYEKLAKVSLKKAKKDAADSKALEVADEEVGEVLKRIRSDFAHNKYHEEHPGDTGHNHGEIKEDDLPELTDEFVRTLGNFENVEDLTNRIRESLTQEKEQRQREKERIAIIDAIVAETKIDVPNLFIESEVEKMVREMEQNIARMGLTMEGYLARIEKSADELRAEWRPEAEKRAKIQLVLGKIAQVWEIEPDEAKVEREVAHILEHYKDADQDSVRMYVISMLRNEEVFRFLEGEELPKPAQDPGEGV